MDWLLGVLDASLPKEAREGHSAWAFACADRAVRVHAPQALRSAAELHPEAHHRAALLRHAEILAGLPPVVDAYAAARDAAASAAAYAAARAARAAAAAESKLQAEQLRAHVRWEWVAQALAAEGVLP
jgi:hypothetical protein